MILESKAMRGQSPEQRLTIEAFDGFIRISGG